MEVAEHAKKVVVNMVSHMDINDVYFAVLDYVRDEMNIGPGHPGYKSIVGEIFDEARKELVVRGVQVE